MRKHWLLFSQTVTVALALLFIVHTLKPELLPTAARSGVVTLYENTPLAGDNKAPASGLNVAAKKAMPAVVNIFTSTVTRNSNPFADDPRFRFFFGDQFDTEPQANSSLGSGVLVSAEGYILTNHHVVESADQIEVALADGRKAKAHVIGSDPETDLAVIKIELPGNNLPAITFGQPENAQVGDIVLAIGNPFGVGETVTMGIVSALKRDRLGLNTFENFIQTDAAINPGNSGGALVDNNGNLIGINSAIYSPNGGSLGIGFAIPANTAKKTMEQIILHGSVTRGWIGLGVQELTPELADSFQLGNTKGVLITEVIRKGPADKAGAKPGDFLISIDDKPIESWRAMLDTVANLPPGKSVRLKLLRDGAPLNLAATIGTRPKPTQQ
jgi:serine protease DegQ